MAITGHKNEQSLADHDVDDHRKLGKSLGGGVEPQSMLTLAPATECSTPKFSFNPNPNPFIFQNCTSNNCFCSCSSSYAQQTCNNSSKTQPSLPSSMCEVSVLLILCITVQVKKVSFVMSH